MSLLDRGPHTVTVVPQIVVQDRYGETTADGTPVPVRCSVQPMSADETSAAGLQVETAYRVIARDWPGGPYSRVEWDGRVWDQQGEPKRYGMSERTRHVDVVITARGAEVA